MASIPNTPGTGTTHLRQLLADDGQPAGPPPITTGPVQPGAPIEVDRLVNATGLISLAGRQHPVGYHFAGKRVTVRLDRGLMQITAEGVLLRSLPTPSPPSEVVTDAAPVYPAVLDDLIPSAWHHVERHANNAPPARIGPRHASPPRPG
ncbi:hypothetical protein [Micromonospora sp. DPT]|uniref:hypothetical protein n=1 Tax=Micromonospora sp. DPT TaxID=3142975 RepID=UPI00320B7030